MRQMAHLITALLVTLCLGGEPYAQTSAASVVVVQQPWARATPGGAKTGAAYMTLINNGASADRLLSATTLLADQIQFHKETEDNGVSRMREVRNIELEPGAKIVFKPGEMHMMLVGLKQPLIEGQALSLTLQFEKADNIVVTMPIEKVGAMHREDMGTMMHDSNHMK
jgi:periplasmic copper chaperone A